MGVTISEKVLRRLRVSNDTLKKVLTLIEIHDLFITESPANIKRWLRRLGEQLTFDFIDVKIADLLSHNLELSQHEIDTLRRIRQRTQAILDAREPYRIADLAVNGNDLRAVGYEGKGIADELDRLLEAVIETPEINNREDLLQSAAADFKINN